jgi:S-adenosylmethionine synthetase
MRLTAATDFRPLAIIRRLGLSDIGRQPGEPGFYCHLAVYGHMGRTDLDAPWERRDLAEALRD